MYKAFRCANGWYVAWENDQGFHHQPESYCSHWLTKENAKAKAARMNRDDDEEDQRGCYVAPWGEDN